MDGRGFKSHRHPSTNIIYPTLVFIMARGFSTSTEPSRMLQKSSAPSPSNVYEHWYPETLSGDPPNWWPTVTVGLQGNGGGRMNRKGGTGLPAGHSQFSALGRGCECAPKLCIVLWRGLGGTREDLSLVWLSTQFWQHAHLPVRRGGGAMPHAGA